MAKVADGEKAERQEKNKTKRGPRNLRLMQRKMARECNDDDEVFVVVADENSAFRTPAEIIAWMEKESYVGTLYPVRFNRQVSRYEQKIMRTVIGEAHVVTGAE